MRLTNLISCIKNIFLFSFLLYRTIACKAVGKNSISEIPLEDNETYQASGLSRGDFMYPNDLSAASSIVSTLKFNKRRSSEGN